ncbi:MAG: hypothetical protein U5K29_00045 [Acidimicrobiales bacterium]|nr:hypothetical protein [Acidimicrobiales bacterium]
MQRQVSERWVVHGVIGAIVTAGLVAFPVVTTVTSDGEVPWFLWLLPVAGLAVAAFTLRTVLRSGFVVSAEGLSDTHELGDETVPWDDVSAFEWEMSGSGSGGGQQRNTYRLVAVTSHGPVRVTSIAATGRSARRITQTLSAAHDEGLVPEHVAVHRPPTAAELLRKLGGLFDSKDER